MFTVCLNVYSVFLLCFSVCRGDILVTQTPESISVQLGGSATIRCKASGSIGNELAWYHQKPGQAPKFIINFNSGMSSGRYQGSRYNYDFSLTISNIQAEDAGVYYCQQHYSFPLTQAVQKPTTVSNGISWGFVLKNFYSYADDTQLYLSVKSGETHHSSFKYVLKTYCLGSHPDSDKT
uniref:Immunoglobulin kappa variable 4-1 n=1 Tax=Sphaeramia orbicularis TaxID=375764 RepID=A0A673C5K1_9TELE